MAVRRVLAKTVASPHMCAATAFGRDIFNLDIVMDFGGGAAPLTSSGSMTLQIMQKRRGKPRCPEPG
jgi:hypothetical protein